MATPRREAKILIIDNDGGSRFELNHMLQRLGVETIETASDGQEGLAKIAAGDYDLVFMDWVMRELNGHGLTQLRRDGCTVPIVATTANAILGDLKTRLAAGIDDYLSKPLLFANVDAVLRKALA
ncbi:response regulator [Propionivibrio dicarboxylicus]|uniref:CheY chemotaxis protein or a CheY-like REC (Receiver) domain n=1 Tax=Propionivibrio dicarboxylicus TaxID=83767 RepID=A0A1G8ABC3_9RHOO|nr:response regulator [Propionivibrio dicarboxylicus]SDH18163.1 CheY chemotaxis protein or a CheY-like REC (receiver) domain [Propionivibrio dicarboxylicus]